MTGGNIFILAKKKNKSVNIKRYKAKKEFNIGTFLFAVVFIYLIVTITAYLLEDKPSIYEVREGSIVKDNTYTGLIIRQETTVNAESGGYINYYQNGNSKVKYGAPVYAISKNALNFDDSSTETARSRTFCALEDVEDARSVAFRTGVPYYVFNFRDNFRSKVTEKNIQS